MLIEKVHTNNATNNENNAVFHYSCFPGFIHTEAVFIYTVAKTRQHSCWFVVICDHVQLCSVQLCSVQLCSLFSCVLFSSVLFSCVLFSCVLLLRLLYRSTTKRSHYFGPPHEPNEFKLVVDPAPELEPCSLNSNSWLYRGLSEVQRARGTSSSDST